MPEKSRKIEPKIEAAVQYSPVGSNSFGDIFAFDGEKKFVKNKKTERRQKPKKKERNEERSKNGKKKIDGKTFRKTAYTLEVEMQLTISY